jgi:hypothetical protein
MKELVLKIPSFAFIVATRAALAGGVGLLLSRKLTESQRRAIGGALIAVGVVSTIPAVWTVARSVRRPGRDRLKPGVRRDESLEGVTRFPRSADDEFVSV